MDNDFLLFYKAYPRKESKGQAYTNWVKLKNKGLLPPIEVILKAIQDRTEACAWPEKQYIKHPGTWLTAWGWEDQLKIDLPEAKQPWHETWPGIQAKGAELGLKEEEFESPQLFRQAVMRKAIKAA